MIEIKNNPLVSVVVITYNSELTIEETLDSCRNQTYKNKELVISDDCSTDDTVEICKAWIDRNQSYFKKISLNVNDRNKGIPANCNAGVKLAEGIWIKLIAGDDLLRPQCLEAFVKEIFRLPDEQIFAGQMNYFNEHNPSLNISPSLKETVFFDLPPKKQHQWLLTRSFNFSPAAFLKKSLIEKVGFFDENYRYFEDLPMWLRLTELEYKINFINEVVVDYRVGNQSMINNRDYFYNKSFMKCYFDFRRNYIYKRIPFYDIVFFQSEIINLIDYNIMIYIFKNKRTFVALKFRKFIYLFSSRRYWYKLKN